MNRKSAFIFLFVLVFIQSAFTQSGNNVTHRKALFVIVDGIPADVIEKVSTPHLDAIAKEGGYTRAHVGGEKGGYSQTPTISAVGYNSLLTGTWVNKHNVWDNDIKDPNYHYWHLFRFFKNQYPEKKTAVFSTWLDNRTKLLGSLAPAAGHFQPDFHFDGLELDTVKYPHDKESKYIHLIDEAVTDTAAMVIRQQAPDLNWVYLEFTDDMGHRYGDSPAFYDAVEMMDKQMGRLWEAIQYRTKKFGEDWEIFITTDHGRGEKTGRDHGGQSDRERTTWIVTNAKGLNAAFRNNPGIVDIMPTIARFMNITIPRQAAMEIDGVPLTGKISAYDPIIVHRNDSLVASWKVVDAKGKMKVWLTTSNNFKTGGRDDYRLVAEVPVSRGRVSINVKEIPSSLYKVVLEGPGNMLNRWLLLSGENH